MEIKIIGHHLKVKSVKEIVNDPVDLGMPMKRLLFHLTFWLSYFGWQVYAEYITDASSQEGISKLAQWEWAIIVELLLLPAKILASYLGFGIIRRMYLSSRKEQQRIKDFGLMAIIILAAILIHRIISNFIAYPIVLGRPVRVSFWEQNYLVDSTIDNILVIGIYVGINFVLLQSEAAKRQIQLQKEKLETEVHFLRAQVNPHFLFNTLNNIYSLSLKKSDLTPQAIMKLSSLMRFMLFECSEDQVTIGKEISLLEDYIELEKLRYHHHRLSFEFIKDVDNMNTTIAPLLLLPFIENAFKHGASENDHHTSIEVNLKIVNNQLRFEVNNSNPNPNLTITKKIGFSNVERQLAILYKEYNLQVSPQNIKFGIILRIDLNSYDTNQMHSN